MKKAIVTGGKGFIGSNLVEYLLAVGLDVTVIDSARDSGYEVDGANYYYCDITQPIAWAKEIFEGIDVVFHLAAEIYVQKSLEFPDLFRKVNVEGTKNILDYCVAYGVKNFILSSTSAIYGNTNYGRGSLETDKVDCLNAYSKSKYTAELLCKDYSEMHSMNITALRYFNVYGNRQHKTGQYAPVIGKFLAQKKEGHSLTVVGNGEQRRDFINVKDVVAANYKAYRSKKSSGFRLYNIGFGSNVSVIELANMISNKIEFIPQREGECKETLADIQRAKTDLDWHPTVSVEEYLRSSLHHLQ